MEEIKKIAKKIKKKLSLPVFRGRFGKRNIRRKSKAKWDKWRRPRGIDITFKKEDGAMPKIGYGRPKEIKHLHPSGRKPLYVSNSKDLDKAKKGDIVIIKASVGKRKRQEIIKKAEEKGIVISNSGKKKQVKKNATK